MVYHLIPSPCMNPEETAPIKAAATHRSRLVTAAARRTVTHRGHGCSRTYKALQIVYLSQIPLFSPKLDAVENVKKQSTSCCPFLSNSSLFSKVRRGQEAKKLPFVQYLYIPRGEKNMEEN